MNCSLFLKNLEKHFCLQKKSFAKHIENLPQRLSEKSIGNNLSITDIALRNRDLWIVGIAPGFSKLSIIVIALVQKSLSSLSLAATHNLGKDMTAQCLESLAVIGVKSDPKKLKTTKNSC